MRRGLIVVAFLLSTACASLGPRHAATVSIVAVANTLELIQNTEMALVCGRPGAPQAPLCVPVPTHRLISTYIRDASAIAIRVTDVVAALPIGTPTPADIMSEMVKVNALIQEVLRLLPDGKPRAALLQQTGLEVRR
jgi:hypothetical protein